MGKQKQSKKQLNDTKSLSSILSQWEENMMWDDHGLVAIGERKQKPIDLRPLRKEK